MGYQIKKAIVIGSGVMGGGIAGHLANAGIPVYLVDIVPFKLTPGRGGQGADPEEPGRSQPDRQPGSGFSEKIQTPGVVQPHPDGADHGRQYGR